jgi:diaminopimelate epimerase
MSHYYRLSGAGNDFLAFAEPTEAISGDRVARWCRRGVSLGADGVLVLARRPDGELELSYFNSDGGTADLCLNGTRCAARLADHLAWADGECRIHTGAGLVLGRRVAESVYATELPPPAEPPQRLELAFGGQVVDAWRVDVGVPHLVRRFDADPGDAFVPEARLLRGHPALGPAGANVDAVCPRSVGELDLRSFERGVEGETLACGTGALAAAAVALAAGWAELPIGLRTRSGFRLEVAGRAERGHIVAWQLAGDARLVAVGEIAPGAEVEPPA